jgi:hypothetical protein
MHKCVTILIHVYLTFSLVPDHFPILTSVALRFLYSVLDHFPILTSVALRFLSPLQWGHQTLLSFGFSTYSHTSCMCSPFSVWPKSNNIAAFVLDLKSAYEREHMIFGFLSLSTLTVPYRMASLSSKSCLPYSLFFPSFRIPGNHWSFLLSP